MNYSQWEWWLRQGCRAHCPGVAWTPPCAACPRTHTCVDTAAGCTSLHVCTHVFACCESRVRTPSTWRHWRAYSCAWGTRGAGHRIPIWCAYGRKLLLAGKSPYIRLYIHGGHTVLADPAHTRKKENACAREHIRACTQTTWEYEASSGTST